jgi:integrase/recombinase XerC
MGMPMPLLKIEKPAEACPGTGPGSSATGTGRCARGTFRRPPATTVSSPRHSWPRYLGEYSPDPDADADAADPTTVTQAHVEAFQAWMIETRSASTALNKHKACSSSSNGWFEEGERDRSPMDRVRQPKTPRKLSEVGNLMLTDVDLNTESVRFHGKGAKDRRVRFGPRAARALSRYLRARAKRRGDRGRPAS